MMQCYKEERKSRTYFNNIPLLELEPKAFFGLHSQFTKNAGSTDNGLEVAVVQPSLT